MKSLNSADRARWIWDKNYLKMSKYISKYEIHNFKKFDFLKVDDLGLINIITGDNNVGKTCFLESLLIENNFLKSITHLNYTLKRRGFYFIPNLIGNKIEFPEGNYFEYIARNINVSIISKHFYSDKTVEEIKIDFINPLEISPKDLKYRVDDLNDIKNVKGWLKQSLNNKISEVQFLYYDEIDNSGYSYYPFISFNVSYSNDVPDFLRELDQRRKDEENRATSINFDHKREVIDTMNEITFGQINDYQVISVGNQMMLGISFKNKYNGNFIPITQLGDGFQKIFRYVVEVIYAKEVGENRLMIDEIDTGIHYSKMYEFWNSFINLVEKTKIQIFATTHSKGCIDSFVEVLNDKNKTNLGRIVSLQEEKDGVVSYTYSTTNLNTDFDYRG